MKPITISIAGPDENFPGSFIVEQDGREALGLGWEELLGHIAAMTMREPETAKRLRYSPPGLYRMQTPEERAKETDVPEGKESH